LTYCNILILITYTVCLESNEVLKLKFRKLHTTIVSNVNLANGNIIGFLFQEAVIGAADMKALSKIGDDSDQQCSQLLALLHKSENPQAFVQLYLAMKEDPSVKWLVKRIDEFTDQSVTDLLKKLDINKATGECVFERKKPYLSLGLRICLTRLCE